MKHSTGAQNKTQIASLKLALRNGVSQVERARIIKATLGTYTAARYMAKRNWTIDAAMFVLCGV